MTFEAWVFLAVVWSVVIGMTGYCFSKVMTSERQFGGED